MSNQTRPSSLPRTTFILFLVDRSGSNDYINNFLQPFMADGTTYTHDQFIRLLVATLDRQLKARINA